MLPPEGEDSGDSSTASQSMRRSTRPASPATPPMPKNTTSFLHNMRRDERICVNNRRELLKTSRYRAQGVQCDEEFYAVSNLDLSAYWCAGIRRNRAIAIAPRTTPSFHSRIRADFTVNAAESQPLPKDLGAMPNLNGGVAWLNSAPVNSRSLRGKIVLLNFWTYTCINSLRALPYVKAWATKYRKSGLVVIGYTHLNSHSKSSRRMWKRRLVTCTFPIQS